jgi:hypothetical protein
VKVAKGDRNPWKAAPIITAARRGSRPRRAGVSVEALRRLARDIERHDAPLPICNPHTTQRHLSADDVRRVLVIPVGSKTGLTPGHGAVFSRQRRDTVSPNVGPALIPTSSSRGIRAATEFLE